MKLVSLDGQKVFYREGRPGDYEMRVRLATGRYVTIAILKESTLYETTDAERRAVCEHIAETFDDQG